MPVLREDPVTAELERVYGKFGVPVEVDIVPWDADGPSPRMQQAVDILGRVGGKTHTPTCVERPVMPPKEATRKITILKDTTLEYPVLCLSIFVQPDPAVRDDEARFARMFARSGCRRAPSVLEADLVVFGGGSDVDPVLYGETPHPSVYSNPDRDAVDMDLYLMCLEHGIPMLGICRGAQFLHVMNGGKLFQDVDEHYGDHSMWDINRKQRIDKISSVHHQMVRENVKGGMEIIGTSAKSHDRWIDANNKQVGTHADIEAFFYRETCCVGIQGHPEYEGYHYFTKWSLELIEELVFSNPDLYWTDSKNLRMKPELMEERNVLARLANPNKIQEK